MLHEIQHPQPNEPNERLTKSNTAAHCRLLEDYFFNIDRNSATDSHRVSLLRGSSWKIRRLQVVPILRDELSRGCSAPVQESSRCNSTIHNRISIHPHASAATSPLSIDCAPRMFTPAPELTSRSARWMPGFSNKSPSPRIRSANLALGAYSARMAGRSGRDGSRAGHSYCK